jgi:hypothetical protein
VIKTADPRKTGADDNDIVVLDVGGTHGEELIE